MKKLSVFAAVIVTAVSSFAVDIEPCFVSGFSVPASIPGFAQKVDRNNAALKTAVEAAQTADADLTDLADGSLTGTKVGTGIAAGNVTTGNLPANVMTNGLPAALEAIIQTGTCTNGQTISFTPAFSATPILSATYYGLVETNANGAAPSLYISSISASSFVVQGTFPATNRIYWTAINVP